MDTVVSTAAMEALYDYQHSGNEVEERLLNASHNWRGDPKISALTAAIYHRIYRAVYDACYETYMREIAKEQK